MLMYFTGGMDHKTDNDYVDKGNDIVNCNEEYFLII